MARQMERHIHCNNLLTVFQSEFRRHHSTTATVLKVTEDFRLSMEDGQVTVLLLLDFSQAFDMVWWCMGCCCASSEMPRTIQLVLVYWWDHISVNKHSL
jgi:hypothetical protein